MSHTEVAVDLLLTSLFNLIHGSGFEIFHFWKKFASEVNRPVGEFTMTFQDVCMKSRNTLTQILLLGCLSRMGRLDFAGRFYPRQGIKKLISAPYPTKKKRGKVVGKSWTQKCHFTVGRICVDFFRLQEGKRGFGGVPHTPVWRDAFTFGGMQKVAVSKQTCAA